MFKILIFTAFLISDVFGVECGNESSMGSYVIEKAKEKNIKVKIVIRHHIKDFKLLMGMLMLYILKMTINPKKLG